MFGTREAILIGWNGVLEKLRSGLHSSPVNLLTLTLHDVRSLGEKGSDASRRQCPTPHSFTKSKLAHMRAPAPRAPRNALEFCACSDPASLCPLSLSQGAIAAALLVSAAGPMTAPPAFADTAVNPYAKVTAIPSPYTLTPLTLNPTSQTVNPKPHDRWQAKEITHEPANTNT